MPLTAKGEEILAAMKKEYGEEAGERVFNASKNAGTITGVDEASPLESLPLVCTPAQLNERFRQFWEQQVKSHPANGNGQ